MTAWGRPGNRLHGKPVRTLSAVGESVFLSQPRPEGRVGGGDRDRLALQVFQAIGARMRDQHRRIFWNVCGDRDVGGARGQQSISSARFVEKMLAAKNFQRVSNVSRYRYRCLHTDFSPGVETAQQLLDEIVKQVAVVIS